MASRARRQAGEGAAREAPRTEQSSPVEQTAAYKERFEGFKERTLYGLLDGETRAFVNELSDRYRLTFQELRRITVIARDLEMWEEAPLSRWWDRLEALASAELAGTRRKKRLLKELERRLDGIKKRPTAYPDRGLSAPRREPLKVVIATSEKKILGDCPVASEKTLCCNLKTIDAVENCAFGCSYCTIQTFYGESVLLDGRFREKLMEIQLDPDRFYHIGSGQSSDSLLWGNKNGILDDLCEFAARHPNVLLELKTKSANVSHLLRRGVPRNVVASWSLNTDTVIANEEHFTASLDRRLAAARRVADRGLKVAFHFHPIVHHEGWDRDYPALARRVQDTFRPEEVLFVSFGSVTFIKPVLHEMRRRGQASRIHQMELVPDPHGKLSYPDDLKLRLLRTMYRAFAPWRGEVFMYLCMERAWIWERVLGRRYAGNDQFEADFGAQAMGKINRD